MFHINKVKENSIIGRSIIQLGFTRETVAQLREMMQDNFCMVVEIIGAHNAKMIEKDLVKQVNDFVTDKLQSR
jgi:hypothetical protein